AVVTAHEDAAGGGRLVSYIVAQPGQTASADELRAYLRARLPEYMVPSAFLLLEQLPLTPSGKIDRRALPAPEAFAAGAGAPSRDPETETEKEVAAIWREVLGVERVGADDNFFELGGHSLLVMQVLARVRAAFGIELELPAFFTSPTVKGVAEAVEAAMLAGAGEANLREVLDLLSAFGDEEARGRAGLGKESDEV
ncbi:MAG: phosphopantetheine-binding protein, partial [Acidobacteriota bacterium]|nr:phosphopantetheine-binding protein [Acidobacteriota bacterium]